jgi:hypothetical protein
MTVQASVAIILTVQLSVGMAASPVIGIATAKGSFRLDNAVVVGNGTLMEGMTVETQRVAGELELNDGVRMSLGSDSRGRVFRDRLILERGDGQVRQGSRASSGPAKYGIEARSLRVLTDDVSAVGRVSIRGNNRVQVAAVGGTVRVTNASGVLLAALPAGHALEFEPQVAGALAPARLTGRVTKKEGHYFLFDETARITVELTGGNIQQFVGHKVEITGSQIPKAKPAGGASQLIQVSNVRDLEKTVAARKGGKGEKAAAGAAAGGAAAGGAATGGAAAGAAAAGAAAGGIATTTVVAGVIVAAAAVGTAVGITAAGDDSPDETVSR